MSQLTKQEIQDKVKQYRWYHSIEVAEGVFTESHVPHFQEMWDFNLRCLESFDFRGKRVLDIGCRDGLFSFLAEKRGAREVVGIDNDLSKGAVEFLIPHFGSKVSMREMNLYDLDPEVVGKFDVVLFFGVLYHLRYPFWGLKRVIDCVVDQGCVLIESGVLIANDLKDREILYCPVERSPYQEPSSCTFFNELGLTVTLRSCNVIVERSALFYPKGKQQRPARPSRNSPLDWLRRVARAALRPFRAAPPIALETARQFFFCRKDPTLQKTDMYVYEGAKFTKDWATDYWNDTHTEHSRRKS